MTRRFIAVGMLALLTAACSAPPAVHSVDRLNVRGRTFNLHGASQTQCPGEYARLIDDIPSAVQRVHWALMEIHQEGQGDARIITAHGILPNDREATIIGWPEKEGTVGVAIQVGLLGDRAAQLEFFNALAQALGSPPAVKRNSKFTLPENF